MAPSRATRQAFVFPRPLAQPFRDTPLDGPERDLAAQEVAASHYRLALVCILGALACFTVGAFVGRQLERGSELGRVLALAPREAELQDVLDSSRVALRRFTSPRSTQRTLPRKVENMGRDSTP